MNNAPEVTDPILENFLATQLREGMALCAESDIAELVPVLGAPPRRYLLHLRCRGLAGSADQLRDVDHFTFGLQLGDDYLRTVNPIQVLTLLDPTDCFHPNIAPGGHPMIPPGVVCPGRIHPGMPLVNLIYQAYEIVTFNRWSSHDGLNAEACAWARNNQTRFPLDPRPLRRPRRGAPATE
jgi:hypothetical protein